MILPTPNTPVDKRCPEIPDASSKPPNPSRARVAHQARAARRAIRRRRFLEAYRTAGALRKAFALSGERWLTVCGMCRDPAFRLEFHAIRTANRSQRPHRNREQNRRLFHALDGLGLPAVVKRQAFKEMKS